MNLLSETHAQILEGDCLEVLKTLEDESVDAVVTDPPYGLSKEPDIAEVMRHWLAGDDYLHNSKGFMGKSWDSFVPGPRYWKEVFRVMKPGAHLLVFCGTRTWDLMSMAIRFAGFENRDTISHEGPPAMRWVYGSGFPKSANVSKQIDRMAGAEREVVGHTKITGCTPDRENFGANDRSGGKGMGFRPGDINITAPATDAAKQWSGWGSAMKPAWECILVFRKPLSESSIARQVLATSTGAINIDGCRVGLSGEKPPTGSGKWSSDKYAQDEWTTDGGKRHGGPTPASGRFPSNLLLSHSDSCVRVGEKKVKTHKGGNAADYPHGPKGNRFSVGEAPDGSRNGAWEGYASPDGTEVVPEYQCARDENGYTCPVALLDEMSGVSKSPDKVTSGGHALGRMNDDGWQAQLGKRVDCYGDSGGASRFFKTFDTGPGFRYVAKSSKRERNLGLADFLPRTKDPRKRYRQDVTGSFKERAKNRHPTCKPVELLRYLCRLITPPGGICLDPFAGSGTTGVAAISEGFDFIGIEMERPSVITARARIAHALAQTTEEVPETLFALVNQ